MSDQRGCLVCVHVLRGERPALLISNAGDIWQVMCGADDHDFDRDGFEENNDFFQEQIRTVTSKFVFPLNF